MGGRGAHAAEVLGSGHDALSKVLQPDPVDDDARGERVLGTGDPMRECQTESRRSAFGVGCGRGDRLPRSAKCRKEAWLHHIAWSLVHAAAKNVHGWRLLDIP